MPTALTTGSSMGVSTTSACEACMKKPMNISRARIMSMTTYLLVLMPSIRFTSTSAALVMVSTQLKQAAAARMNILFMLCTPTRFRLS